jgi:hypothetical protein
MRVPVIRPRRLIALSVSIVAVLLLAAAVYEYERPPALSNVTCQWRSEGVVSAGDISNPSFISRTFAIRPRYTFQGMGVGVQSMHVYVRLPPFATRHWSVDIDMHRYAGHRITSCTPYAYGATKPED